MSIQEPMPEVSLSPAQVVEPRKAGNEVRLSITVALDAAGLSDAPTLEFYDDEDVDADGLLVAKGLAERVDGRSSRHVALISKSNDPQRRITVPKRDYDRLGLDPENDQLPNIVVYAGPQTVAFAPATDLATTIDRPDEV